MGAEVEVVIHGKVLEGILPDLVLSLVAPRKDVEVLVLCVFLVDALEAFFVDGPLNFRLCLPEGKIGEFLVDEQPAGVLFNELYEAFVVIDCLVLVNPLDLVGDLVDLVLWRKLVLFVVLEHVLDGHSKAGEVVGDGEGELQILDYLFD